MKYKFKVNDIVKLISGGPGMTVTRYITKSPDSLVSYIKRRNGISQSATEKTEFLSLACSWFEGEVQKFGEFEEEKLELA